MKSNTTWIIFYSAFGIFLVICIGQCLAATKPRINPTKLECTSLDESYVHVRHCYLKPKNGFSPAFAHFDLKAFDVTNVTYKLSVSQKNPLTGKYMPLLTDVTGNVCDELANMSKNQLKQLLYEATTANTNINHTCPFNHDIIFDNYLIKETFFQTIPIPPGDYFVQAYVGAYNEWKLKTAIYTTITPRIF